MEKERKVLECEFCDRKFVYKKSYTHHMHSEHGVSDDSDDVPLSTLISKSEVKKNDVTETEVKVTYDNGEYFLEKLIIYNNIALKTISFVNKNNCKCVRM